MGASAGGSVRKSTVSLLPLWIYLRVSQSVKWFFFLSWPPLRSHSVSACTVDVAPIDNRMDTWRDLERNLVLAACFLEHSLAHRENG